MGLQTKQILENALVLQNEEALDVSLPEQKKSANVIVDVDGTNS